MNADALYQSLMQYLDVKAYVLRSSIQGHEINVGENFKLRIRVTNNAPGGSNHPDIRFRNARVVVHGTEYARPMDGSPVSIELDDALLTRNGDDGRVDVTMRAEKAIFDAFGTIPGIFPEKVARVSVRADVDQDAFFRVTKKIDAFADIVTT